MKVDPHSGVHLAAPNELELASMFNAAKGLGLFENPWWFKIIDSINTNSVFLNSTSPSLAYPAEPTILNPGQKSRC